MFDETLFPFSKLHPNAGARIRAEISLLPDSLLNPSSIGDENVVDHSAVSSTNPSHEPPDGSPVQASSDLQASEFFPSENRRHFMIPGHFGAADSCTDPGADSPAASGGASSRIRRRPWPLLFQLRLPPLQPLLLRHLAVCRRYRPRVRHRLVRVPRPRLRPCPCLRCMGDMEDLHWIRRQPREDLLCQLDPLWLHRWHLRHSAQLPVYKSAYAQDIHRWDYTVWQLG